MTVSKPETVEVTQALEPCRECQFVTGPLRYEEPESFLVGCKCWSKWFPTRDAAVEAWQERHRLNATPSRQDGLREALDPFDVFDMGYAFGMALREQNLEDSRAVGRLLWSDTFKPIHPQINAAEKELGFDSFQNADSGICQAKRIIRHALAALSDTPPPDNEETEALKEAAFVAGFKAGERETQRSYASGFLGKTPQQAWQAFLSAFNNGGK